MQTAVFHIVVIAAGTFAAVRGWHRGLSSQTSSILGMAFGLTMAHITGEWSEQIVAGWDIVAPEDCREEFVTGNIGRSAVFATVYIGVDFLTGILNRLLRPLGVGLLNSLAGSVYRLFVCMMWMSIAFNVLLCLRPECGLDNCGDQGDGNLVAEVMLIAPNLLGTEDVCDLWHICRLHDARLISFSSFDPRWSRIVIIPEAVLPLSGKHIEKPDNQIAVRKLSRQPLERPHT